MAGQCAEGTPAGEGCGRERPTEDGVVFGLLGRTLAHSWSPQIHAALGSVPYALIEREPEEVEGFVRHGSWRGLNVTIPYKRRAFELADEHTPAARRLGVANTLVRLADGRILADNTDLTGFAWMLERFCVRELSAQDARSALEGREALVLGSGGASHAVVAALEDAGAHVSVISRSGDDTYETLAERHPDAALVCNATPVGMFPGCPASPVPEGDLARLRGLSGVLDVVYNPTRTGICLAAERLGVPSESGLAMLVSQACRSSERFLGRKVDDALAAGVERDLRSQTLNVALIGMPGSGKTTCGKRLARLLKRPFVDLDDAFGLDHGISPAACITERGEAAFRALETETLSRDASRSSLVIACGGGVVTREENYALLRQNSTIVALDRPLEQLSSRGRPLSASRGVERLARERMGLYRSWANLVLACTGSAAGDAEAIRDALGL